MLQSKGICQSSQTSACWSTHFCKNMKITDGPGSKNNSYWSQQIALLRDSEIQCQCSSQCQSLVGRKPLAECKLFVQRHLPLLSPDTNLSLGLFYFSHFHHILFFQFKQQTDFKSHVVHFHLLFCWKQ